MSLTNEEMMRQLMDPNHEWDTFTKANVAAVAALMFLPISEEKQSRIYYEIRAILDQHPEHAETVLKLIRTVLNGVFGDSAKPEVPGTKYTISVDVKIDQGSRGEPIFRVLSAGITQPAGQPRQPPGESDPLRSFWR